MAKKKGFFSAVGRFLGSIPAVGKAKKAAKSVKKKAKAAKKKIKKAVKKAKKKLKKKIGKVFTKARKLKNNLSKSKLVRKVKQAVKKVVIATKKAVKKVKSTAKAAAKNVKQTTKAAVQQVKQTAKTVTQQAKQVAKAASKQVKKAVTAVKSVDILQATSIVVDFIPIVGNVKSGFEAAFGFNPITLDKLSKVDRGIAVAGILGGPLVKGVKHGSKMATAITSNVADSLNNPAVVKTFDKLKDSIENMKSNMILKTDNDFAFATAGSGKDNRSNVSYPDNSVDRKKSDITTSKQENKPVTAHLKNIDEFVSGNKKFDEVLDDYATAYAEKVNSNVPWKWRNIPGGDMLSQKQIKLIRERTKELGKIPDVSMKPGTKYPDFEKVDLIIKIEGKPVIKQLPKEYWKKSDPDQFGWLDSQLPGGKRPPGTTWHHSEIDGRMELVPLGIHNSVYHSGGRAPGGWAHGKR